MINMKQLPILTAGFLNLSVAVLKGGFLGLRSGSSYSGLDTLVARLKLLTSYEPGGGTLPTTNNYS